MIGSRLTSISLLVVLVLIWEGWLALTDVSALLVPPPSAVMVVLWTGLTQGFLWPHIWVTVI